MLASASQIERALLCPASALLPRNRREPSAAAKRGTLIHALIAADLRGWKKPDTGRYKIKYDLAQLEAYLCREHDDLFCELAMTWNPAQATASVHGENIGREYPNVPGIHGTADIVVVRPASALIVDIKTGQPGCPARESWQLKHNALCAYQLYDCERVTAALAYLNRDGSWMFDEVTWGAFALEAIADDLMKYAKQAKTAADLYADGWDPLTNPSEAACRYCDAVCSARYGQEAA